MLRFPTPEYLDLSFRPDLNIFIARWQQPVTTGEMRLGYQHILAAAVTGSYLYWLLDIRRRNNADLTTLTWLIEDYFPSLATQLGQEVCISYLLSPSHLLHLREDGSASGFSERITSNFRIRQHADELEATEWLREQQAQGVS